MVYLQENVNCVVGWVERLEGYVEGVIGFVGVLVSLSRVAPGLGKQASRELIFSCG